MLVLAWPFRRILLLNNQSHLSLYMKSAGTACRKSSNNVSVFRGVVASSRSIQSNRHIKMSTDGGVVKYQAK